MKTEFPRLYMQCLSLRSEVERLSGFTPMKLKEIANEFDDHYEAWQYDYKGPALPDQFMGFGQMLEDWQYPWSEVELSNLTGLSPAQCYFGWSFAEIEIALGILTNRLQLADSTHSERVEEMARAMTGAAKSLVHAKHLMFVEGY